MGNSQEREIPDPADKWQHPWEGKRVLKGSNVGGGYEEYISPVVTPIRENEAEYEERVKRELEEDGILPATKLG
ncbi:MAG TPA: hypothetical protein PK863_01610 [Candidatus Dojkabacteria bacterium]|nr:hypothetical protein [Candidatus Dojkabacteria bacterium]HRP36976.1 hypothetical protein [Candidatus Dojkabacteria bacterium]HRP50843.1 hypothetical protein [Candidatus Dojkabacteria bacterium]